MFNTNGWTDNASIGFDAIASGQSAFDPPAAPFYSAAMNAVEFTTELSGGSVLQIPAQAAAQLPKAGKVRVIILTEDEDSEWRGAAYEQFLREDPPEDSVYDSLR